MGKVAKLTQEMRIDIHKLKDEKIRRELNLVIGKIIENKTNKIYSKVELVKDLEAIVDFSYFDI